MRLDHLLSKEHLAVRGPVMGSCGCPGPLSLPNEWGTVLKGGTSTMASLHAGGDLVRQALRGSGWERSVTGGGVGRARCWVLREQPKGCCPWGRYESHRCLWVGVGLGWLRAGTASQTADHGVALYKGWPASPCGGGVVGRCGGEGTGFPVVA